jgi:hypothetical protein
LTSKPFAADAVCRSLLFPHLIPQIKNGVMQFTELRKSDPPLHLPPLESLPAFFFAVKLINEFLIAL